MWQFFMRKFIETNYNMQKNRNVCKANFFNFIDKNVELWYKYIDFNYKKVDKNINEYMIYITK